MGLGTVAALEAESAEPNFHAQLEQAWLVPLWERHGNPQEETGLKDVPHVWRWEALLPVFDQALDAVKLDVAERRSLSLCNPGFGYAGRNWSATKTLNGALQLLMPGESARPHRHSLNALRFGMEGTGAVTIVNGKRCPMNPGDLIVTPAWTWHEHVSESRERTVWFNVLDVPVHRFLGTRAFEPGPVKDLPAQFADEAFVAAGLVPQGEIAEPPHSPIFYYGWEAASRALAAAPPAADGSRTLRYVNPLNGAPIMALLDCWLLGLAEQAPTAPYRSTSSALALVVAGEGESEIGESRFAWKKNDIIALPQLNRITHRATSGEAVLFVTSDREIYRRLGLLREERLA